MKKKKKKKPVSNPVWDNFSYAKELSAVLRFGTWQTPGPEPLEDDPRRDPKVTDHQHGHFCFCVT